VAYRLYLTKDWAEDKNRRRKVGVPEEIGFKTKPEIALEHIRWAREMGLPGDLLVLDAGYGNDAKLRTGITELEKVYVAGIQPQTLVWAPGTRHSGAPKKGRRDAPMRSLSKRSPSGCVRKLGARSLGVKARMKNCRRGLPGCVCTLHRGTNVRPSQRKSGC
jgi:SRSO17 transposase